MHQQAYTAQGLSLLVEPLTEAQGPLRLVWLHGWGQSRDSLRPLAHSLLPLGESWLLDFPGHGALPPPTVAAAPADLARTLLNWLATLPPCPTLLIGHSMGFRVALHAASQQPSAIAGLVAVAGAGVPRRRTVLQWLKLRIVRGLMRAGKGLVPLLGERPLQRLRANFGSPDYRNCPPLLRPMLIAQIKDDATPLLAQLTTPTLLLYGLEDEETPPDVGQTFAKRLPKATLHLLPHHNHYTLLTKGQHVVTNYLKEWIKNNNFKQ